MHRCEDFPCCGHYDADGTFCPPQPVDDENFEDPGIPEDDFNGLPDYWGDGIYDSYDDYLNNN